MADQIWTSVFPADDEHLMSAAEMHIPTGRRLSAKVYRPLYSKLLQLPDEELSVHDPVKIRKSLTSALENVDTHLGHFAVLNYPLPR